MQDKTPDKSPTTALDDAALEGVVGGSSIGPVPIGPVTSGGGNVGGSQSGGGGGGEPSPAPTGGGGFGSLPSGPFEPNTIRFPK